MGRALLRLYFPWFLPFVHFSVIFIFFFAWQFRGEGERVALVWPSVVGDRISDILGDVRKLLLSVRAAG